MTDKVLGSKIMHYLKENGYFLFLIFGIIIFKWDQLFYTIFWDEPTYAHPILTQKFEIFHVGNDKLYSYTPHIFGYSFLLYMAKLVFGGGLFSLRFFTLINFIILMFGFKKHIELFSKDKLLNSIGLLSLFFIPIFIPFSTMIQPDLFVLNAGIWIFYFYQAKRFKAFWITAFFSSFLFETVIAFVVPIIAYEFILLIQRKIKLNRWILLCLTQAPLLGYLVFRKIQNGLFLFHNTILEKNNRGFFSWLNINHVKYKVLEDMMIALVDNIAPFILLVLVLSFILKEKESLKVLLYSLIISSFFVLFWFFFGEYHARNLICAYGFIALSAVIMVLKLEKKKSLIVMLLLVTTIFGKNFYPYERNTPDTYYYTYRDGHNILLKTLNYIYQQEDRNILTFWPIRVNIHEHAEIYNIPYHNNVVDIIDKQFDPEFDIVMIDLFYDHDEHILLKNFVDKHNYELTFQKKIGKFTARYYKPILIE